MFRTLSLSVIAGAIGFVPPAAAQDREPEAEIRRTRIALGPQLVPAFPGADRMVVRPFVDFIRANGDEPFGFEAADESFGFALVESRGFEAGPAIGFEGARRTRDARGLPRTGFTVEPGGFVQYSFAAPLRVRIELRHGIGGHRGFVGTASGDYIVRDRDDWLFAIGPRVTFSDGKYQRAYFGVPAGSVAATGLPAFTPSGGVHAIGANAGYLRQLTSRWGVYGYARYDRLIDDAARSPYIRRDGARDQWSIGLSATFTFVSRRD